LQQQLYLKQKNAQFFIDFNDQKNQADSFNKLITSTNIDLRQHDKKSLVRHREFAVLMLFQKVVSILPVLLYDKSVEHVRLH
jgi:hypothetical protein